MPHGALDWVNDLIDEKSRIYFLRELGSKKNLSHRRSRWMAPSAVAKEATMDKWNTGPIFYDEKSRRIADEMVQAETRHTARRAAPGIDCDCKDGMFPRARLGDRRAFLFAAGSLAVGA